MRPGGFVRLSPGLLRIRAAPFRMPVHMVDAMGKLRNLSREFLQEHGREPSVEELAECSGMPLDDVCCIERMAHRLVSLDQPLGESEENRRW